MEGGRFGGWAHTLLDASLLLLICDELLKLLLVLGAEPVEVGLVKGWCVHLQCV